MHSSSKKFHETTPAPLLVFITTVLVTLFSIPRSSIASKDFALSGFVTTFAVSESGRIALAKRLSCLLSLPLEFQGTADYRSSARAVQRGRRWKCASPQAPQTAHKNGKLRDTN